MPRPPKSPRGKWSQIRGDELAEAARESRSLEDTLPEAQGIYIWRRNFRCPSRTLASQAAFEAWIEQVLSIPIGTIQDRRLSHFAHLESLVLAPAPLPEDKRRTLAGFVATPEKRRKLATYLSGIAAFSPPLYVGETHNLPKRIAEHLAGDTRFGSRIEKSAGLSWADLDLFCLELGDARSEDDDTIRNRSRRTLLEILATDLTLSAYVERRG